MTWRLSRLPAHWGPIPGGEGVQGESLALAQRAEALGPERVVRDRGRGGLGAAQQLRDQPPARPEEGFVGDHRSLGDWLGPGLYDIE